MPGANNLSLSSGTATVLLSNTTLNLTNYTGTATLNGVVSGAGSLTLQGTTGQAINLGTLALASASGNTFLGGFTLSGGAVQVGSNTVTSGGFITSGPLGTGPVILNGGTLQTDGNSRSLANTLSLGATGAGVQLIGTGGLTFSGATTLTANTNLVVTGTGVNSTTFSAPISGAFNLTQSGTGTLQLTAAETYSGTTTVNAGTVILGGNGSILNSNNLVLNQGGALTLDDVTGGFNIPRLAAGATMQLNGGTFNFTGNTSAPSSETISSITLNSGGSVITLSGQSSTLSTGLTRPNLGATLAYQPAATGTQQILITGTLPTLTSGILPYVTVGTGSTTQFATINGTNFLVAGTTTAETLNSITLTPTDNVSLPSGDTETLAANTVINSLTVPNGATINLNGKTLTITSGGLLNDGGSGAPVTFTNGTVQFGATDGIVFNANGGSITFGTTTSISGTGGLTVGGNGTVNVNNANSFTGGTFLDGGILSLGNNSALGTLAGTTTNGNGRSPAWPRPATLSAAWSCPTPSS